MQAIKSIFKQFDLILLYAYIWQIPFAWRYIFIPNRADPSGGFNEYMDISIYVSEILLFFAWITYILNNKRKRKSINRVSYTLQFHVEQLMIFLFLSYLFFNIALSIDPLLSLVSISHFTALYIFYYLLKNLIVSRGTYIFREIFVILSISLIIQFGSSLFQVINFESSGLFFINESLLRTDMLNVAKSNIFDHVILRGYGTFSHPNILGAFCLFSAIFILEFRKLFHVKRIVYIMVLALAVLTIFLTQSKLSLLAVTAIILFYVYRNSQSKEEFHVKHWKFFIIILISAIVFVSLFLLRADIVQSYKTRIYQYSIQQNISTNTSIGSGIGTYRISYNPNISSKDLWNYEPVHFVPYIVIKEMGIVGLIILLAATSIYIGRVPHGTFQQHYLMYAFLLFILVIDHFAWDIHQGQSILFFGLLLATLDIDKRLN